MIKGDKSDSDFSVNNVLPEEINLVHFDKPKSVDWKSLKMPSKQDKYRSNSEVDVDEVEKLGCINILNLILPPKQWEKNGVTYCQTISNLPPTQLDVKQLGEKLDTYLEQFNAKEVGICPIKRELFSQCFNEVIRQVMLNCAERGFMLIKIRDEMNMTIDSYQELYESVVAHGIRKVLLKEHKKADLEKRAEQLKNENVRLNADLVNTTVATEKLELESAEARDMEVKRHEEELNTLKETTQLLKDRIESLILIGDEDI